jgi:hypothetical protein
VADIIGNELLEYEGNPALLIMFNVSHAENADGTTVRLNARAVWDEGRLETEPPIGARSVQALRWVSPTGEVFTDNDGSIFIASSEPTENWQVLALLPDDMMANIELTAKEEAV